MLAPDACGLLVRLGLEEALLNGASASCPGILSFWNPEQPELSNFALTRLRDGRVVDRPRFDSYLRRLAASAGADVLYSTKLRFSGSRGAHQVSFLLESSGGGGTEDRTAAFVVEAAGRNAVSGEAHDNCTARLYFDRLVAVPLDSAAPCGTGEWLRIAPSRNGWWYKFSGGSGSACVFLTDADLLPKDAASRADQLRREWREAIRFFGAPDDIGTFTASSRDARTSCRRVLWRNQWLPLGDAAFTLDPLSGSGLSRALRTADTAASAVYEYLATRDTTALSQHAVGVSREFAASLAASRKYYGQAADYFPDSRFWRRRSGLLKP